MLYSCRYIIYKHKITIVCPKCRDEAQFRPQLPSNMWSRVVGKIGSQSDVMFRIEYMQFHIANIKRKRTYLDFIM
jgi:hypothetical protein